MKAISVQCNNDVVEQTGLTIEQWIGFAAIACALSGALSLIYQVYQSVAP